MARPPAITDVQLSLGSTTLNGIPLPSYLSLYGIGEPGDTYTIFNATTGTEAPFSKYAAVQADGSLYATSSGFYGGSYRYYVKDTTTGAASPTVELLVGTTGADTLAGPTLGTSITGPTFLFGQGSSPPGAFGSGRSGDDTFVAYTVLPDAAGQHATGASVAIQGGSGINTVALPVALGGLLSHEYAFNTHDGRTHLVLHTADAQVDLDFVQKLRFTDVTLTAQGDPLADFLYYDARYPDLAAANVNARNHYAASGWHEGRDPNALFSTLGYLGAYGDVRAAGQNPLDHYDLSGWKEGRDPSAAFDTSLYLRFNPDVAAARVDPLLHYLGTGLAEGRKVSPVVESAQVRDGFDPLYYKLANPDVSLSGVDPLRHYQGFGAREGRNPDAFFDANFYLAHNPDVAAAGLDPLAHYNQFGWREGRDPSGHFSTSAYLAHDADVVAAGINPLQHFLQYGILEGRSAYGDLF